MPNYQDGKIYKIVDNTNGDIYIGSSTIRLSARLQNHKQDILKRERNISVKKIILNNDYKIVLLEKYPCNSRDELYSREQYYIDNNKCVNKRRAKSTEEQKQEQMRQLTKIRYNKNRQYELEYNKNYSKNNRLKINLKRQQTYKNKTEEDKQKLRDISNNYKKYTRSWGGDKNNNNNLLCISMDLFF
jgi:hypothetical protein